MPFWGRRDYTARVPACPAGGEDNPERARFCLACGLALAEVAKTGQERKLVSVLFVDIVGSTARAHGADPEDVRDVLRAFQEPVRRQVELHGGNVEKFIGDAVVAVFGARVAHGDDSARAVRCGLRIVEEVEALNASRPELRLAVRAGVATGEAVVELGEGASRGEPLATGDVLNTAARLQTAAPTGGVVVSAETFRATRRAIQYHPLAPIAAKGMPAPLEAWQALLPVGGPELGAASPLVGRDRELATVLDLFEAAASSGSPAVATITGEPGIGKSRLAAEVALRMEARGAAVLRGRCLPYAERRGYQATGDQLRRAAGIFETDAPPRAREKLDALIRETLEDIDPAPVTRALSLVLGLGIDEPLEARELMFFAVRQLLQGLSARRPTVFVFDDLQWSDESQLALVDNLVERLEGAPVLLLLLSRPGPPEALPDWTPPGAGPLVTLAPLEPEVASAMAVGLLGVDAAPAQVESFVTAAGGNPLFLEELAASLHQGAAEGALPTTVREALASRIDRLPPAARALLLDASVTGETFWRGPLVAGREADVDALLGQLVAAGFVVPSQRSRLEGDVQYAFKHVLVRDAAYGTLTRQARRERHAAVARHLETVLGNEVGDLDVILAHHWREAADASRAIEYLLVAAERAGDAWARDAALELYASAADLAAEDDARRARIRLRRALTLVQLADFQAASDDIDAILPALTGREREDAVLARAWSAYWLEDTDNAVRFAALGRELANRSDNAEIRGPALVNEAFALEIKGDIPKVRELYEEAHRVWVPGTRQKEYAALHEAWGDVLYWTGDYTGAEELATRSFELGRAAHAIQPALRGGGWKGLTMAAQGRSEDAIAWLEDVFRQAQELDPKWGAAVLNYTSLPYRDMRRFAEARTCNERALEVVARRGAWGMAEMQGAIDLMFTDLAEGELGRVQSGFAALWQAAINGKAWRPWLGAGRLSLVRAELAREIDDAATAAELASDALVRAERIRRPKYEAAARSLLGQALLKLGQGEKAMNEMGRAIAVADKLGSPSPRWEFPRHPRPRPVQPWRRRGRQRGLLSGGGGDSRLRCHSPARAPRPLPRRRAGARGARRRELTSGGRRRR